MVGQIKIGGFARGERIAKINEGLRLEETLGAQARFAGRGVPPSSIRLGVAAVRFSVWSWITDLA